MSIEARTTGLRLGAIGIGLLLAAVLGSTAVAADLKIGFTLSLTGGTDDYGKGARMGAELALKEYNDKGGYQSKKVEAVIYDDETKPAKGVENVTRLITRDKVFAIARRSKPSSMTTRPSPQKASRTSPASSPATRSSPSSDRSIPASRSPLSILRKRTRCR